MLGLSCGYQHVVRIVNEVDLFLLNLTMASLLASIGMGIAGIVLKRNVVKKVICLGMVNDAVAVLLAFIGFRAKHPSFPPVWLFKEDEGLEHALRTFVDPLPQALVVTSIVIGVAFTLFLSVAVVRFYEDYGVLSFERVLEEVEGEVEEVGE